MGLLASGCRTSHGCLLDARRRVTLQQSMGILGNEVLTQTSPICLSRGHHAGLWGERTRKIFRSMHTRIGVDNLPDLC